MKRLTLALLLSLLLSAQSYADDNIDNKDNSWRTSDNQELTIKSKDYGSNVHAPYVILGSVDGYGAKIDSSTNSLQIIEYPHHEGHSGNGYELSGYIDLTINNVYDIQITTPNTTKWAHFELAFDVENETLWHFYRNVNIIQAGTAYTPLNTDHNSSNTSGLTIARILNSSVANANLDTAVAGATIIAEGIAGSGFQEGGGHTSRSERILKQNEGYSLRFIATAAGFINWHLTWYEHTNAN